MHITAFYIKYKSTGEIANTVPWPNSFDRLHALCHALAAKYAAKELEQPPRLLVLVDEYDRYVIKLMLENTDQYLKSIKNKKSETSLVHPLRSLFETLKAMGDQLDDYRTFVIGITPLAIAAAS